MPPSTKTVTCFSSCVRSREELSTAIRYSRPRGPVAARTSRPSAEGSSANTISSELVQAVRGASPSCNTRTSDEYRPDPPEDGATRPVETETETSALSLPSSPGAPSTFLPESAGATARTEIGSPPPPEVSPEDAATQTRPPAPPTIEVISDRDES